MRLPEKLQGKMWKVDRGRRQLTSADLQRVLDAIERGESRASAIPGAHGDSDRIVDRATQILRRERLIKWVGGKQKWALVDGSTGR